MLFLEGKCPHCGEKRGINIFAFSAYSTESTKRQLESSQINKPAWINAQQNNTARFFATGTCVLCDQPILVDLEVPDCYIEALRDSVDHPEKLYKGRKPEIQAMWPQPVPPYSHPTLPGKVRELFVDLQTMLKQNLAPSLIIAGCRSVLEEAVKKLNGDGDTLHKRIEDLKSKDIINGVLYEWAISIKKFGNDASHELAGTTEEAAETVEFTRFFLQYTFECPARVCEVRAKKTGVCKVERLPDLPKAMQRGN